MKIIKLFASLVVFLMPILLYGQEDCSVILKKAEGFYEQGNIERVQETLKSCLESGGFSKADKEDAYKLLALVSLFEDNFTGAEQNMINLLKTNPDFVPKTSDPIEIKDLYAKFRTNPLYTVGVKVGLNSSYTTLLKYYSVNNSINNTNYSNGLGFQIVGDLNLMIAPRLMWNIEPSYSSVSFVNSEFYNNNWTESTTKGLANEEVIADQKINYKETQNNFGISTGFKLNLTNKRKATPYIISGIGYNMLLKSKSEVERSYTDLSGSINADKKTLELQKLDQRQAAYFIVNYGLGIKYKLGTGNLVLEARHIIGLNNITKNRYQNELVYKYNYVLDDVTINSIQISVGYIQSIYKPKVLKRKL